MSVTTSGNSPKTNIPQHVAIIMDGNGRWAEKRGLPRHVGHEQGAQTVKNIIQYAHELGIKYVTLYVFSTENWQRPRDEIDAAMHILHEYLQNDVNELVKNGIRITAIGQLAKLPEKVQISLREIVGKTSRGKKLTITLALSYGAVNEVIDACKKMVSDCVSKKIAVDDIDEKILRSSLYTHDLPDPDLVIRTGGEVRLSNFLLLQISYSELYFSNRLWPDFSETDFALAIRVFQGRRRRFGKV